MLNEVFLQGQVSENIEEIEITGKRFIRFRIKVQRAESGSDSINCLLDDRNFEKVVRSVAVDPDAADVSIAGRIQTRFFKSGGTVAAVTEVVVHDLLKI
jgi:hypothetical protein